MDADVYGPSIPHLVGATGRPMAMGERIMPIEANGLKLMSMGFLLEPERAVIMRGPMLHGIMQQFLHQVEWGQLDYLVIDLPPGTGDVPLTLAQSLPLTGAVVVCTPQEVALIDAVRAVAMFRQLKVPILGMIENMSFFDIQAYLRERGGPNARDAAASNTLFETPGDERVYLFGRGGARRKAESMGVPFLGEVPLNILLRESGDDGRLRDALAAGLALAPLPARASSSSSPPRSASRTSRSPKMPKLEILELTNDDAVAGPSRRCPATACSSSRSARERIRPRPCSLRPSRRRRRPGCRPRSARGATGGCRPRSSRRRSARRRGSTVIQVPLTTGETSETSKSKTSRSRQVGSVIVRRFRGLGLLIGTVATARPATRWGRCRSRLRGVGSRSDVGRRRGASASGGRSRT